MLLGFLDFRVAVSGAGVRCLVLQSVAGYLWLALVFVWDSALREGLGGEV